MRRKWVAPVIGGLLLPFFLTACSKPPEPKPGEGVPVISSEPNKDKGKKSKMVEERLPNPPK